LIADHRTVDKIWGIQRFSQEREKFGYIYRLEKNGKLPTSAPADEQAIPTIAAMINSKGHRLCEVGSLAVSTGGG
jgi:hypothetical protein